MTDFKQIYFALFILLKSYNMIGNIKFSLIIIAGIAIFGDPIKSEQILAIFSVMIGKLKVFLALDYIK